MPDSLTLGLDDAGVAVVTITRAKALNALNASVLGDLQAVCTDLAQNSAVRALLLAGEGDKAFVAGADITELQSHSADESRAFIALGHSVMTALEQLPFPTIAVVQGFCLGGGLELALACDFIVAGPTARFGQPEVSLGIIPGFGGTQRLARRVGAGRAKEMIFSGRMVSQEEALAIGLADRGGGDEEDALTAARTMLAPMVKQGPCAIRLAKRVIQAAGDGPLAEGLKREQDAFAEARATADAAEGLAAFLAKRAPEFHGR